MMQYLITGATGAIGSAIARRLAGEGADVRAFVRDADKFHLDTALMESGLRSAGGRSADHAALHERAGRRERHVPRSGGCTPPVHLYRRRGAGELQDAGS